MLDVEAAPDRFARLLTGRRNGGAVPKGSPLNEIINVSTLEFVRGPDGVCTGYQLTSFHRDEYSEQDILANAETALTRVAEGGLLATFNGKAYDLPLLRLRQMRWWQCESGAAEAIAGGTAEHIDVMMDLSMDGALRWASLEDACASVGFALRGPAVAGRGPALPYEVERCEVDVIGTAILLLYVMARRERSTVPLRRGLPAIGDLLRGPCAGRAHLHRFADSELLEADAMAWGAGA
ncbi:hypothetical protein [Sphingomonas sp.]|uniref:hypothetical protein n=1 Tax=Sphingomonas sp. TaxID=28214 RepID=UPI002DD69ECF|nr:hypothetical protein [Sphingomonas sp.]